MPPLRTALLQSSGQLGDAAANLRALDGAAARAAAAGAGLLVAPELFLTGYAVGADVARLAEPADGPSAREAAGIAARHGLALAYGYPERDGERVYNSARLVGPDGTLLANYRKTHLYGDFEREWFVPGDRPVVQAEVAGVRVGLMICYDVEFPENVRAHALAGTDLLLVPTALMHPAQIVAESVVPVRAFENQLYIAYANRTGPEGEFEFVGLSALTGPDGTARARAGRGEELVVGDADPELLRRSRDENPYLRDRRPALYAGLV
ncbi:carbon-nitrogen hydrolase family protein [Streptomyces somaliensis DSM 40738]|uniref:Carbon-nitrogen hydrolase family protein n=1 Tax=Streptomyces somaliensis (strain ATCC 33201 / DSM 40738 / JCM 12659 / KCTC 9044 / NCTC 11332 / NRRL B-12077 / IP 733) TaxID=1134445 RepID=A0AA44DGT3_STRE0|nr:carbon-nitrogen hydrolase family protein [Streptomyces somaliensis]MCQ0021922.1 carbon-nitrogen hydrolase family protein [Streptomyces somaliensis DSM 40738]NKY16010.1 carbon-nitrogen hydrolase family protein [Streptomyces somaliensis DSM 40738]